MALLTPLLLEAVTGDTAITYHAQDYRNIIAALVPNQGTLLAADLAVTQRAAGANMSVDVAAGSCFVKGGSVARQGTYICPATTTTNVALTAPNASNPRIDLIVAQLYDKQSDGGTLYGWNIIPVAGTPAGSPVAPSVPTSALLLAQVYVPANATSILNSGTNAAGGTGSVTDKRVLSGNGDVPKWDFTGSTGQALPSSVPNQYVPDQTLQLVGALAAGTTVTILTPGRYVVSLGGRITPSGTYCDRTLTIEIKNAAGTVTRRVANTVYGVNDMPIATGGTVYLSAGDVVSPFIYQDSGGSLNATNSNLEWAFTGVWVGA